MAKTNAWMPVYIGDYLGDTARLTTEQHGAYLLLMFDYWRNGPPPVDDAVLCQITKLPPSRWQRHKDTLMRLFQVDGGLLRHPRIDAERVKAEANQDRRSDKASKAAQARWEQAKGHAPSNAPSNATSNAPECPPPSPSFSKEKGAPAPVDPTKFVFGEGVALLTAAGDDPKRARSFLGGLRKQHGDHKVAEAIGQAQRLAINDPRPWLVAAMSKAANDQSDFYASIGRTFGSKENVK